MAFFTAVCLSGGVTLLVLAGFGPFDADLGFLGVALCVMGNCGYFHRQAGVAERREREAFELGRTVGHNDGLRPIR